MTHNLATIPCHHYTQPLTFPPPDTPISAIIWYQKPQYILSFIELTKLTWNNLSDDSVIQTPSTHSNRNLKHHFITKYHIAS